MRLIITVIIALCTSTPTLADFRAGAATADITPKMGVLLDGAISKPGPVKGVHDPLHARAIAMTDGTTTIAIVINDSCMIEQAVYDKAKIIVNKQIGLKTSRMLMAATHSHATPRAMHIGRGKLDDEYHEFLSTQIARAVIEAHSRLAPAIVAHGTFDMPKLIACRRFFCQAGSVAPNPFGDANERVKSVSGFSNKIIRPAGPVDPQFSVLSIRHADGSPLAVLGNFSVHYCGGYARGMVSADYFGVYATRLEEKLDSGKGDKPFVGIMSNGTSGDTGSIQLTAKTKQPAWERMRASGRMLADETIKLIAQLKHEAPASLVMVEKEIELGVRKPDAARLAWAKKVKSGKSPARLPHRWSRIYAHEAIELSSYPDRYRIKLQALRIGDIAVAAAPCEVFAETGLAIKANSPFSKTFTIELANGYSGYLPTPGQHMWGGYETWPARTSHLEVQAEPQIRSTLLELLKTIAPDQNNK